MANDHEDPPSSQPSDNIDEAVDMGDLNNELGKRLEPPESAILSVDFGDLKGELDKGKDT